LSYFEPDPESHALRAASQITAEVPCALTDFTGGAALSSFFLEELLFTIVHSPFEMFGLVALTFVYAVCFHGFASG